MSACLGFLRLEEGHYLVGEHWLTRTSRKHETAFSPPDCLYSGSCSGPDLKQKGEWETVCASSVTWLVWLTRGPKGEPTPHFFFPSNSWTLAPLTRGSLGLISTLQSTEEEWPSAIMNPFTVNPQEALVYFPRPSQNSSLEASSVLRAHPGSSTSPTGGLAQVVMPWLFLFPSLSVTARSSFPGTPVPASTMIFHHFLW